MIGWYIGDFIVILVVIPVALLLLQRLVNSVATIKATTDDILEHGVAVTGLLEAIPKLVQTRELTGAAYQLVRRYGAAIQAILTG